MCFPHEHPQAWCNPYGIVGIYGGAGGADLQRKEKYDRKSTGIK